MASLPLRRDLSARPSRSIRPQAPETRSRSHDVKRLPPVARKDKDAPSGKPSQTPRADSKPRPPSKLRPHPAFQVILASEEQMEAALRACPVATAEANHGVLLLEFFGVTAQEVLSTYNVQITEQPCDKPEKPEVKGRQRSKSSTPRTPREEKAKSVKRSGSGSVASVTSERSECDSDGWVTATCWVVPGRRNEMNGPTCSSLLALALPASANFNFATCRQCRLQYKSHDWVKWGLAVRKDPASWLGQVSMPLLLGLEKPSLMCSVERAGPEGSSHKLILHWSVKEDSNKFLLRVGSVLWQYRWRWCHVVSPWMLGSIKKTSPVEWGNYISAPLLGEWSAGTNGTLEVSLRYTANPHASLEMSTLNIASSEWSDWSDSTGPVAFGLSHPEPGNQEVEVYFEEDPCRANVKWRSFVAEAHYRLEYRLRLRQSDEEKLPWKLVAWREATTDTQEFTQKLVGLMAGHFYTLRVQARYAGGDGSGGGWSTDLTKTFQTPSSWPDDSPTLCAPELVPEPAGWATRKGVATQVTRRFALLPDDPDVELEWSIPGQRWEKLSFSALDGIASFDVMKLQYRLGKNADALIRWTSHGKLGEIAWTNTGMEVPCLSRVELRDSGAVEVWFDTTKAASFFQIRCEEANGEVDFPPVAIQPGRDQVKFLLGPTKLSQISGRSFRLRLGREHSWSPWSPVLSATAPPLPGPRPNSLRTSTYLATAVDGYSNEFDEMVAATSKGTTMKLSWEGFTASDSDPVSYHLKLKPQVPSSEVFLDTRSCTVSTHLGLQQCETVLRQLMPNTEYTATLRADGDEVCLSTTFETGDWTSTCLRPLMPPQRIVVKVEQAPPRNVSFQKFGILLDPRMALKGPQDQIYQLQWRPLNGPWHPISSLEVSPVSKVQDTPELEQELLEAEWLMADMNGPIPHRVQLRMALQDPVARVLLPERLWFSEASIPLTCGFDQPDVISPKLTWSNQQLLVEISLSQWTQDLLAEKYVTQFQVRFQGDEGDIFYSDPSPVSALSHVNRQSPVTFFVSILSLPFRGNCHYTASLRVGEDGLWSNWSDWGSGMSTSLPQIWSKDKLITATKPMNCKVKLDWLQLCCDLGAIPVECTVTMRAINEMNTDQDNHHDYERLIAMTSCTAQSPQMALGPFRDRLEVAINGFDPGATYQFILHARPHLPVLGRSSTAETLLKMEFQEVARSEVFQWPSQLSEEWSCMVNWSLPVPRQVLIPDDGELEDSSRRWQGRAVLLAWPQDSERLQLEVREDSQYTHQVFGWQPCQSVHIRLANLDFMAACDLPSDVVRFRWRAASSTSGPCSDACIAQVPSPMVTAELIAGRGPRLRLKAVATGREDSAATHVTFARLRYKVVGGTWKNLVPKTLGTAKVNNFCMEVGEEHGLEVGKTYIFSMQFLAPKRRSQWSAETAPITLQPPKLPVIDAKLLITAKRTTSVIISWPELQVPPIFAASTSVLEFRLDLYEISDGMPPEHRTSILVEADGAAAPTEAKVFNLWPATEYSVELFLRCVHAGVRRWHPTGLTSNFITPADG